MSETTYWVLGGFAGAVAIAAVFGGDIFVAVAAAVIAAILFAWAYGSARRR